MDDPDGAVVDDPDGAVVDVDAEFAGSVVVVDSVASVDDAAGTDDGTVRGVGSEEQAAATSTTMIGRTSRTRMSVGLNDAGGRRRLVCFAGYPAALRLIDSRQQVDTEYEEDDEAEHRRS